jgi:hypothetical protein
MPTKKYKWWQMRMVRLTREYVYGIIGGLGLGLSVALNLPGNAPYSLFGRVIGPVLMATGCWLMTAHQERSDAEAVDLRFTIRDLFWLTFVVAMGLGWWLSIDSTTNENAKLRAEHAAYVQQHGH